MSSTLANIQTQLNRYGYPTFLILGTIGNIFMVILFKRQRQNACSIYLITSAITNIVFLITYTIFQLFLYNYNDGTIRATIICKIRVYLPNFLGQVSKTILVLACIDRFMITHNRASFRAFSTPKRAKYLILFSIIFWLLFPIHAATLTTVVYGQCIRVGIYSTVYNVYIILVVGLIPSITLSVFSYLTYRHVRQMRNSFQPIAQGTNNSIKQRDRDLLIFVITEVFVYVITTSLFPLVLLEMTISQYVMLNKSFQYLEAEIFTLNVSLLLLFINSAAPFYSCLISSKSFRRDFKQLIINSYRKLRRQPPVQTGITRRSETLTQRETHV